jgi:hypothetical protein
VRPGWPNDFPFGVLQLGEPEISAASRLFGSRRDFSDRVATFSDRVGPYSSSGVTNSFSVRTHQLAERRFRSRSEFSSRVASFPVASRLFRNASRLLWNGSQLLRIALGLMISQQGLIELAQRKSFVPVSLIFSSDDLLKFPGR